MTIPIKEREVLNHGSTLLSIGNIKWCKISSMHNTSGQMIANIIPRSF